MALLAAFAWTVPRLWCGRHAKAFLEGGEAMWTAIADEVARQDVPEPSDFTTGSERFDGEWAFATCQMTIMGLGQVIRALPGKREKYLPAMRECARAMQTPQMLEFASAAWGEEGLSALEGSNGHAYLGYLALALGVLREHDPGCPEVAVHDDLVDALERRLEASASGVIETYPGEAYPADVSAVVGSIGQRAGADAVQRWSHLAREKLVDPDTGLLFQSVDPVTAEPRGVPRASGTALAIYFLSFADPGLSEDLYEALVRQGYREPLGLGFGTVREYPEGTFGIGDVDSGPVILGFGTSATGFALAGARIHGDGRVYRGIFRSAVLAGCPVRRQGRWRWMTGGAIGNAILLAMLTASPVSGSK